MSITVVAFHTDDDVYTRCANNLRNSLIQHKVNFHIESIPKKDWHASTCYKPAFIRRCLDQSTDIVVYTDSDSMLVRPFDLYSDVFGNWDVAYAIAPWKEILAGTIAFKPSDFSKSFIDEWISRLTVYGPHPKIGDQAQFQYLIKKHKSRCFPMPHNYCKIFDMMKDVPDPIFIHYQASRVGRTNKNPESLYRRLGVI